MFMNKPTPAQKKYQQHAAAKKSFKTTCDPVRQGVWRALCDVTGKGKTLDDAFASHCSTFADRDRAFAYNLAATTLRYGFGLDKCLQSLMDKPFPTHSSSQQLLRMGLCQLLLSDGVKDHAAIATTVDLAKSGKLGHLSGVLNGVLRNAQRTLKKTDIKPGDTLPPWFFNRLKNAYGIQRAAQLTDAMLVPAAVDMRCRHGTPPAAATKLAHLPDGWRLPDNIKPTDLQQQLADGSVYIQDEAAQWPAFLLAQHMENTLKYTQILDVCAAPGGKTLQLADFTDSHVVGADISAARLAQMGENTAQTQNISRLQADAMTPPFAPETFSGILLDAPCTATGTTRRHPEVMHLRRETDIQALEKQQRNLLKATVPLLQKGGVLVYAVCSLLVEEGEKQHTWIIENLPLSPLVITTKIGNLGKDFAQNQPTENALRLTPLDGCDGFYIALYQKT